MRVRKCKEKILTCDLLKKRDKYIKLHEKNKKNHIKIEDIPNEVERDKQAIKIKLRIMEKLQRGLSYLFHTFHQKKFPLESARRQ